MKKNLKQALVPLAVMVFGAAAAFTTNAVKQSEKQDLAVTGYYYDITQPIGKHCVEVLNVNCVVGPGPMCTDSFSRQLWADKVEDNDLLTCSTYLSKL